MTQIDDLTLIKFLGKGAFGEVYLSQKKNSNKYFATKRISREIADRPKFQKYLINELDILKSLDNPHIVKLEEVKKSKNYYYIVMEYINGGGLSECLNKYIKKNDKPFSEEIIQYLMRQIIEALDYIHDKNIIHRDLKLDNIMVNFDNESDKENLDMMKAKVKIIDFGFAVLLKKDNLANTAVGSPINMDPIILEKYKGIRDKSTTYDTKADIWSIGTVCYELLTGKAVFDAENLEDLVGKVKKGTYHVPVTSSNEVVTFLKHMLVYDSNERLSAKELLKLPFLTKNVKDFKSIKVNKTTEKKEEKIKNKSIWDFKEEEFSNIQEAGNKNENIKENNLSEAPNPEEKVNQIYLHNNYNHLKTNEFDNNNNQQQKTNKSDNNHHNHHKTEEFDTIHHKTNEFAYNPNKNNIIRHYKRANTVEGYNPLPFYGQPIFPNLQSNYPPMINQYNQYNAGPYPYQPFGVPIEYPYSRYNQYHNLFP